MRGLCGRGRKYSEQILDAPRPAGRKEILSRNIFQGKKYYLGIFYTVFNIHLITLNVPVFQLIFIPGQLVQGGAVLQVPRDAPRQHQLRGGAGQPGGSHTELR